MKKIAAILLLAVLMFNWIGYRFIYNYFERQSVAVLQSMVDDDLYNENALITFKVPLSMPYGPNSDKFEKVRGQIEVNGISYQYVKRRFYKDSLEVFCIPNTDKAGINNARDEFFKLANDFNNFNADKKSNSHHNSKLTKLSVDDFTNNNSFLSAENKLIAFSIDKQTPNTTFLSSDYRTRIEQPPQLV